MHFWSIRTGAVGYCTASVVPEKQPGSHRTRLGEEEEESQGESSRDSQPPEEHCQSASKSSLFSPPGPLTRDLLSPQKTPPK